jgi:hypothetical protein
MAETKPTKKPAAKKAPAKLGISLPALDNMLLVHAQMKDPQSGEPLESFSAIPIDKDCPYLEVMFDPRDNTLGIKGIHQIESIQYLTKLNNKGLPQVNGDRNTQAFQPYAQERKFMKLPQEYYLRDEKEIGTFLKMVAVNKDFDWKKFWKK